MRRLLVAAAICLLSAGSASAASTILTPTPLQHFVDNTGFACYNCQLFTYAAGTDTKLNTFTDSTGNTPNTDPIILNARGEASVWLAAGVFYKFVLAPNGSSDPPTNPIWTVDNISALGGGGLFPSFFEAPAGPTYDLSGTDNGAIIVSSGASAGLALVLPSTTTISSGWTIAIEPSTGHPVSLTVNGSSGGNIITDTGASVTALTNLGNQKIQVQFDGTNFQFGTNRKTVVDPRDFGCALDGVTNDAACMQDAWNAAIAIGGAGGQIDCAGGTALISAQLTDSSGTLRMTGCTIKADPAVNWASLYPAGMIDVEPPATNVQIVSNTFDGSSVSSGVTMNGHAAFDHFDRNYMFHVERFGLDFNGIFAQGNTIVEWLPTDAQYLVYPGDYTTSCFWGGIDGGADAQITNNTPHNCLMPFEIGAGPVGAPTAAQTHNLFIGNHPWNGITGATVANPIDIYVHLNSTGNDWWSTYLDHGQFVSEDPNLSFYGGKFANLGTNVTLTSWFNFIATSSGEGMPWLHMDTTPFPKVGTNIPLVDLTASGGNSWSSNIPPTFGVTGVTTGNAIEANGADKSIIFMNKDTFPLEYYGGGASFCLGLNGNGTGDVETDICHFGPNEIGLSVPSNSKALYVTAEGNVGVSVDGSAPTCTGCGTGYSIIGGNVSGYASLGTSPSTTIVITFAIPAGFASAWSSLPNCSVQENQNFADITSISTTETAVTIRATAPIAANTIHWWCVQPN